MKTLLSLVAALVFTMGLVSASWADEAKKAEETTLKGTGKCAKCHLGETAKCQDVLEVRDGDKTVTYWLNAKGLHKLICTAEKSLTITGKVAEKDGKKWVEVSKFEETK